MWQLPQWQQSSKVKRLALLTSGGDAPGMNAAIRAVVRSSLNQGIEVLGVRRGYQGLVAGDWEWLNTNSVSGILQRGGTWLKTARCMDFHCQEVRQNVIASLQDQGIEALVVIGGDGSLKGAQHLASESSLQVVGLPGSIDNDIFGTDESIGFDTAVNTAVEALDRIRDTAYSHERVFLVEVMGRASGFIALQVALAGGADYLLLPDQSPDLFLLEKHLQASLQRGKPSSTLVIAEGANKGLPWLADHLSAKGYQCRTSVLGHIQRGGSPSGRDRMLASTLGHYAVKALQSGFSGVMLGVQQGHLVTVPFEELVGQKKPVLSGYERINLLLAG